MLEYRITWSASSNISFYGHGDWREWDDDEASQEDIENALNRGKMTIDGLEEALNESGFEWGIEIREKEE
jgi:hypothetical protein